MRHSILILISAVTIPGCGFGSLDPVSDKNEAGNRLFASGDYEGALQKYRDAQLEREEELPELHFNAGDALYKQEGYEEALQEFGRAIAGEDTSLAADALYNLGNALFRQGKFQESAEAFKQSLSLRSDDLDAKINLELALQKTQEEEQQEDRENEKPPEPSDYAKELKAQADALVARYRYQPAYELMMDGMKIDATVRAYQDFIQRVKEVVDIEGNVQ